MKTIQFDFDNRPGISRMYAIPVASFLRLRKDYRKRTTHLEVKDRDNIIDIPVHTSSFMFKEDQSTEVAGETYNIVVSGSIPKISGVNRSTVYTLEHGEWLVLHQDNNGTIHLSGTVDDPLSFHSGKSTGSGADGINGNVFSFSGITPDSSVIIVMLLITSL